MTTAQRHENDRRLLRARDAMDRCYADALDIEALADSVHLSRAHFIRSFKETFGETPHRTCSGDGSSGRWLCCGRPTGR